MAPHTHTVSPVRSVQEGQAVGQEHEAGMVVVSDTCGTRQGLGRRAQGVLPHVVLKLMSAGEQGPSAHPVLRRDPAPGEGLWSEERQTGW